MRLTCCKPSCSGWIKVANVPSRTDAGRRPVRLLGVIVSNLEEATTAPQDQLDF